MAYTFLLFDLDHTLLDFDTAEEVALTQFLQDQGVQDIQAFKNFDWTAIGISYMSIPLFVVLYVYYKVRYKTKMIPLEEVDLSKHK